MSRILVSLLSEHSVPNFLFIKQMEGAYDELLFLTTTKVDKDGGERHLLDALGMPYETGACIEVDADDFNVNLARLEADWQHREGDEYLVNLTGGTKLMSLAAHVFFSRFKSRFFYVPFGKNVYCDIVAGLEMPISYRITLKEYFALYGLTFTADNSLMFGDELPSDLFGQVRANRGYLTRRMRDAQSEENSPEEKKYYGGRWFEEYVFLRVKEQYRLGDEFVAKDVKIFRSEGTQNDNELDVIFMIDNALHVIECKVTMYGYGGKPQQHIEGFLYKLAAISKDYGLKVNSYLVTSHKMDKLPDGTRAATEKRQRILGIKGIIGFQELCKGKLKL